MICPHCQKPIPDSQAKFCPFCGTTIIQTSQPSNNSTAAVQTQPNKKLFFFGIGLILILLLAGGVLSLFRAGKSLQKINLPSSAIPEIKKSSSTIMNSLKSTITPTTTLTKTKYDIDTAGDSYPDFLEIAIDYDPNKDECLASNPCDDPEFKNVSTPKVNVIFILDSSGSMAQMAGSEQKMAVAKGALSKYIANLPEQVNVGLMVYGHTGSNNTSDKTLSCNSIEMIYPLGKIDKNVFSQKINTFQPTGWTPIGSSLLITKQVFSGHEKEKNMILLISDGIETCDSNPVGAATEVKNAGLDLTIDVIGFNLDSNARSQLKQVATIGGGTYFDAQTSQDFKKVADTWWENFRATNKFLACSTTNLFRDTDCLYNKYMKAIKYLLNLRDSAQGDNHQFFKSVPATTQADDDPVLIQALIDKIGKEYDLRVKQPSEVHNQDLQRFREQEKIYNTPTPN